MKVEKLAISGQKMVNISFLMASTTQLKNQLVTFTKTLPKTRQTQAQSHKNPVSVSAMLTGKFLQIRKVFATSSSLAEEFPDMQNVQMNWKVSGRS